MSNTPRLKFLTAGKAFGAAILGAALFVQPVPAHAAGGGGSDTPDCPRGQTWDKDRKKCVPAHIDRMNDEQRYQYGWKLARTGEYAKAIEVLKTADMSDPRVLNYIGYSYRKSGDLETGIGYYKRALAIDPDFVLAREYLGEGYVKAGRLDLAKLELEQIGKRCGKGCKEYVELAAVINGTDKATW